MFEPGWRKSPDFRREIAIRDFPAMPKTILFIYGTLKRGQKGHHLIADQEFLGEATTMPLYRLFSLGWHPGMVLDTENGLEVKGELWAVDESRLMKLDEYEGVAESWYLRGDAAVRDCFESVQTYFFNGPIPPQASSGAEWPFAV
jgi:gamma-glutamylaminecyclotransferase